MVERSRPERQDAEETKMIDTRSKGIRDDDENGFMGAEDKTM